MLEQTIYIEYWPLATLLEAPINPKEHDLINLGASMNRWGYTDPMMIDERTGRLVRGHGRREQLLLLQRTGAEPPLRIRVREDGEWLVPVVRGVTFNSDDEALAYSLADNKLTESGGWNTALLSGVLADLVAQNGPDALAGTGFSDVDLARIQQLEDLNPYDLWKEMPEFENQKLEYAHEVKVRFMTLEDLAAFATTIGQTVTLQTKSIWFPPQTFDQYGRQEGLQFRDTTADT